MKKAELIQKLMESTTFKSDLQRQDAFDRLNDYNVPTLKSLLKLQTLLTNLEKK